MKDDYSIYTLKVSPNYKDLARALLFVVSVLLMLHVLMAGQPQAGLTGFMFNGSFSETLAKVMVALAFYYLVVRKIIHIS
jgi:hypothetical protein